MHLQQSHKREDVAISVLVLCFFPNVGLYYRKSVEDISMQDLCKNKKRRNKSGKLTNTHPVGSADSLVIDTVALLRQ